MSALWDHYEQWKLRLMNNGHRVAEIMCNGAPPAIGARVYYEEHLYGIEGHPDVSRRMRRITAVVRAQDAHVTDGNCYLLVIARVESSAVFVDREGEA